MSEKKEFVKLVTPKFRVSFPQVFTPKAMQEGQQPFYSVQMIFPKKFEKKEDQTLFDNLRMAVASAIVKKWGNDKNKWPKNLKLPFRDGEEKEGFDGYGKDVIFINAKSKDRPGVIDQNKNLITEHDKFYAGCYARATLSVYAFSQMGNNGVAFGLQNLQFLGNGEPFSGRRKATDDFDVVEGAEDLSNDLTNMNDFGDLVGDF